MAAALSGRAAGWPAGLSDQAPGPEARYESREAISLAFVTAVQLLPPNQRAVLLLRDVLGYRASETARLLGLTEDAVTSALKRARATMDAARPSGPPPPPPGGPEERALVDRFVAAFTDLDVDALVALMTDDVWVRMPPLPFEYRGTAAAHRFFTATAAHRRQIARLVPVRANGQPAWGEYRRDAVTGALAPQRGRSDHPRRGPGQRDRPVRDHGRAALRPAPHPRLAGLRPGRSARPWAGGVASFRCRLVGTLAGRPGSCLAGGAGRVLAWRMNATTGPALRNADPAERQLPSAQRGSWCVRPHGGRNRNRAFCFLAVSDHPSAGYVGR